MDTNVHADAEPNAAALPPHTQTLLIRQGRGRTGGSTGLDFAIQRARHQGRRVKPPDGDLRSRTLSGLYPQTGRTAGLSRTRRPRRRPRAFATCVLTGQRT